MMAARPPLPPPTIERAGKLIAEADPTTTFIGLVTWLGAMALIAGLASGRGRLGLLVYAVAALGCELVAEWQGWTYSGSTMSQGQAIQLALEGLPWRLWGWAQIGALCLMVGGLLRLSVLGLRRLSRPV
jgi:hypothetical protein